jgi:hypothetical protein
MKRIVWLTGLALVFGAANELRGDDVFIDKVEEDWEVVISEPAPEDEAPQILNVISPNGTQDNDFFVFELNHCTQPDYTAGGLQLQHWVGQEVQSWENIDDSSKLAIPQETITYTLRMRLYGDILSVSVRNGESQTWGQFDSDPLRIVHDASVTSLNGYRSSNSVAKSRIGFASYRVTRFVLKEVRYYSQGVLVQTDADDQVVHEYEP